MRHIALVGNAPPRVDASARIEACDRVVRFNGARGVGGRNGSRTDELWLINRGGQAEEWVADPDFERRSVVAAARRICLPLHPDSPFLPARRDACGRVHRDDADWTDALRERLAVGARTVTALPAAHHVRCCETLGLPRAASDAERRQPSTGFVALVHYLDVSPADAVVHLHGFTFEGWEGHPWAAERAWVRARVREGRVVEAVD